MTDTHTHINNVSAGLGLLFLAVAMTLLAGCAGPTFYFSEKYGGEQRMTVRAECGENRGSFEAPIHTCDLVHVHSTEADLYRSVSR